MWKHITPEIHPLLLREEQEEKAQCTRDHNNAEAEFSC